MKPMKYSLMSLMVDSELRHNTVNFMLSAMLRAAGVQDIPQDADEAYALAGERGLPLKNGTASFEDLVRFTKEHGFDALDMMSYQMEAPGETLREILEKYGVTLSAVNIISPFSEAADEADFQRMLERTKAEIDLAIAAGAENIMLVPGGYQNRCGYTREQLYQNMVRGVREGLAYTDGRASFSTETLETSSLPWCSLGEMQRILDAVPGLMYTHDTGNPLVANEDPAALCSRFRNRVVRVHFKDLGYTEAGENAYRCMDGRYLRLVPLGTGVVDFAAHLRLLDEIGFDGYITLEGGRPTGDPWQRAVSALAFFRDMEQALNMAAAKS